MDKNNTKPNELISKYNKIRFKLKIVILILLVLIVVLFFAKKNILLTSYYIKGQQQMEIKTGENYKDSGAEAKFLFVDISDKIKVDNNVNVNKVGKYKVEYKLKISFLNIDRKLYREVTVVDGIPPVLEVDKEVINLNLGEVYNRPNYKANDNNDGDITSKVEITGSVDVNIEGDYVETLTVKDSSGNVTTKDIKVKVEPKYKHSYIVVNKNTQYLEYYEYDNLVYGTYVVTGNDYNTPIGTFAINRKIPRAKLKGDDYEVDVNYWMAFIGSSHGFHDAPWRSRFGGNIYLYDPSHGCINLPTYAARDLYYMVDVGTPVYIIR